ncbi:hypothetical protein [Hydrogenophaga laconesensis]|uniref:Uncharacterized protein n=1 Tax=Hydrogenophaga laconesensis TaxID=1805971 RepID=A0ABU1VHG5_9BURK|nr:hypothetical protein [Hydrogenophaga laconesensis]MDR7096927.1 hypothetical protein [Hydrogenophaga laconesensis]
MDARRPREALPDTLRALAMVSVITLNAIGYPRSSSVTLRAPTFLS